MPSGYVWLSRDNCVTFKVKIPNGYPCPSIKMLSKIAILTKICSKKIPNGGRQRFDKKIKSGFQSQNVHLSLKNINININKNIKAVGPLCCFKIQLKIAKFQDFNFIFAAIFNYVL